MRYFIYLSFKGTRYHGWQRQPGSVSVQEILEKVLTLKLGEAISVTGAGRTDTGVHALTYCAHFECTNDLSGNSENLIHRLNRFLPEDIAIERIVRVHPDASARFSAVSRTYIYRILRNKEPFSTETGWYVFGDLDIEAMNRAASLLLQYNDFASFCRTNSDVKTTICRVSVACWSQSGDILEFTIRADRFLRNMVRAITGTMVDIGQGKTTVDEFRAIIEAKDRKLAGQSAPARGLFLAGIEYPSDVFEV
jgi:tRNA pseudouridine38-40 synthase